MTDKPKYPKLDITFKQSPNYSKGKTLKPDLLIIHAMAGTFEGSKAWFMNPKSQVSAHWLVSQKGEIHQALLPSQVGWHTYGVNSRALSIELEDRGRCLKDTDWITPELWDKATKLAAYICHKYNIPVKNIHGHNAKWIQDLGRAKGMAHQDPGKLDMEKFKDAVTEEMSKF